MTKVLGLLNPAARCLLLYVAALAVSPVPPATAQDHPSKTSRIDVAIPADSLLDLFAWERRSHDRGTRASSTILHILRRTEQHPQSEVNTLLDGLERLALTADHQRVRQYAAIWLSIAGERGLASPVAGTAERLIRIYQSTTDPNVRGVLLGLPLTQQAERDVVASFLGVLATEEPSVGLHRSPWDDVAAHAIGNLTLLGEAGRRVLRDLHARNAVRSPHARQILESLAERGFQRQP